MKKLRLGVNIDHVATLRNARGETFPDPVQAALLAVEAGADGITAHLREDRRHIRDADMRALKSALSTTPLNFEMAATDEMMKLALEISPHACCLVPEKREERTTEGGLDVASQQSALKEYIAKLKDAGIRISLFIEPDAKQIEAAQRCGAPVVEFHTGTYCHAVEAKDVQEAAENLEALKHGCEIAALAGLEVHAGHGITFKSVHPIAALPQIAELNIGHFLIADALFNGLAHSVKTMRQLMDDARLASRS